MLWLYSSQLFLMWLHKFSFVYIKALGPVWVKEKKPPLSCCCATRGNTVLCARTCLLMLLLFFIHKSQLFQNDHIKYLFLSGLIWLPLWMMPGAGWGAGPRRCLGNGWRGWGWLRMRMRCWTGGRCFGLYGGWGCCLRPGSYDHQNPENRGTERLEMWE